MALILWPFFNIVAVIYHFYRRIYCEFAIYGLGSQK